jgi:DNA-binding beta-propeller fold protein YncE
VQRFSVTGELLGVIGGHGSGPGQLSMPWGIEIDGAGDLYVVDWGNDRVQKLSADGHHLRTFGSSGHGEGQLHRPCGVSLDSSGNVYVSDYGNDRVQVFQPDGTPLTTLLGEATMTKWGVGSVEVDPEMKALREALPHVLARERLFRGPMGVEIDAQDRIFIADCCRHRVQVYQRE